MTQSVQNKLKIRIGKIDDKKCDLNILKAHSKSTYNTVKV